MQVDGFSKQNLSRFIEKKWRSQFWKHFDHVERKILTEAKNYLNQLIMYAEKTFLLMEIT
jgi:hypothetical protein